MCLVGPTATGKTALAVTLSREFGLEVVTCDSMQVYKKLDIGTAKPTAEERGGVPHHMLDVAEPWENYNAARFAHEAELCLADIALRGKRPLVAGGTGLYLRALTHGLHDADGGEAVRDDPRGDQTLYAELQRVDPETAARLHPNDRRRVLRALSVFHATGTPLSEHHRVSRTAPGRYETLVLGLDCADRESLYRRIDLRVDEMLSRGLRDEVWALLQDGLPEDCTAMQAIGYKEMAAHLRGEYSLDEAARQIKLNTRHLAKRQRTWFRRQENVCWLEAESPDLQESARNCAKKFLCADREGMV